MTDIISVVAGGWSVSRIDLSRIPGTIIAINDSAIHLPRFDIVVSMDRLWTEHRYEWMHKKQKPAHIRRAALANLPHKWPWLASFECDHKSAEFSGQHGVLNGTNSGLCGFNLAYQERPSRILLFGFDMMRGPNNEPYWHEPYSWRPQGATTSGKYKEWSLQFECAKRSCEAAGIDVMVVGLNSRINCFPKIPCETFARVAA